MKEEFKTWPVGKLPPEWQRPELGLIKEKGYNWNDPREAVDIFEQKIADYAGSKYAVSLDSCTNSIFLCLKYVKASGEITIPSRTYLSIPMAIMNAGCKVNFEDIDWSGIYQLKPYDIYDSSTRFTKGMYVKGSLQCLSFQIKKRLPIGKGGMILTDDKEACEWFKQARFEARHLEIDQWHDNFDFIGWNMYMTPEDAARGILIFDQLPLVNEDTACQDNYPDLSKQKVFNGYAN